MHRRCLNDPKILIMDEPKQDLILVNVIRFRNLVSEFSHGRIVLISTHIVSDMSIYLQRMQL